MPSRNDMNETYTPNYGALGGLAGSYRQFPSPYLNYDPVYLPQAQPEFIYLDGAKKQRGRFELAFGQIGSSVIVGAAIGGAMGFYGGLKATTLAGQTGMLRRTQLINHIMKKGSSTANTFGSIAVIYSAFGVLLSLVRGNDDDYNTIIAATASGCVYRSTAGLRKCGLGGAIGLAASLIYSAWNSRDKLTQLVRFNPA